MPTYTFHCEKCDQSFEIIQTMASYTGKAECPDCKKPTEQRVFDADLPTSAIVLGETQITVGHLALRNTERLSSDEKAALHKKHNSYKEVKHE